MSDRVFDHPPLEGPPLEGPPLRLVKRHAARESQGLFGERAIRPTAVRRGEFPLCYGPTPDLLFRFAPFIYQHPSFLFTVQVQLRQVSQELSESRFHLDSTRIESPRREFWTSASMAAHPCDSVPGRIDCRDSERSPGFPPMQHRPLALRDREPACVCLESSAPEARRMASPVPPRSFKLRCTGYRLHRLGRLEETRRRLLPLSPISPLDSLRVCSFRSWPPEWPRLEMPGRPRFPNFLPLIEFSFVGFPPPRRPGLNVEQRQASHREWAFSRGAFADVRFHSRPRQPDREPFTPVRGELSVDFKMTIFPGRTSAWKVPLSAIPPAPVTAWEQAGRRLPTLRIDPPASSRTALAPLSGPDWRNPAGANILPPLAIPRSFDPPLPFPTLSEFPRPCRKAARSLRTLRLDRTFLRRRVPFSGLPLSLRPLCPPLRAQAKLSPDWTRLRHEARVAPNAARTARPLAPRPVVTLKPGFDRPPLSCRFLVPRQGFLVLGLRSLRRMPLRGIPSRSQPARFQRHPFQALALPKRRGHPTLAPDLERLPAPDLRVATTSPELPKSVRMRIPPIPFLMLVWEGKFPAAHDSFDGPVATGFSGESGSYRCRPAILLARRLEKLREFIYGLTEEPIPFSVPFRWYFRRIRVERKPLPVSNPSLPSQPLEPSSLPAIIDSRAIRPIIASCRPLSVGLHPNRLELTDRIVLANRAMRLKFIGTGLPAVSPRPMPVPAFHPIRREEIGSRIHPFPFGFPTWTDRETAFSATVSPVELRLFFPQPRAQSLSSEVRISRFTRHRSATNLRFPRRFVYPVQTAFSLVPHTLLMRGRISGADRRALTPTSAPLPRAFLFATEPESWVLRIDGYRFANQPLPDRPGTKGLPVPPWKPHRGPFPRPRLSTWLRSLRRAPLPIAVDSRNAFLLQESTRFESSTWRAHGSFPPVTSARLEAGVAPVFRHRFPFPTARLWGSDLRPLSQAPAPVIRRVVEPPADRGFQARFRLLRFPWRPEPTVLSLLPCRPLELSTPRAGGLSLPGSDPRISEILLRSFLPPPIVSTWSGGISGLREPDDSLWSSIPRLPWEWPKLIEPPIEPPQLTNLPPTLLAAIEIPISERPAATGRYQEIGRDSSPSPSFLLIVPSHPADELFRYALPSDFSRLFFDGPHFVITGFRSPPRIGKTAQPPGGVSLAAIAGTLLPNHSPAPSTSPLAGEMLTRRIAAAAPASGIPSTRPAIAPATPETRWALMFSPSVPSLPETTFPSLVPGNDRKSLPPVTCRPPLQASFSFLPPPESSIVGPRQSDARFTLPPVTSAPVRERAATPAAPTGRSTRKAGFAIPEMAVAGCSLRHGALPEWIDLPSPERPMLLLPQSKNE